jgi:hypothetical protein
MLIMDLSKLFIFHAIVTLAAGIVLVIAPPLIPETVSIKITPNEYLICYFLGAAEFAISYLSFFSRKIKDPKVLQLVSSTFIVFHLTTGMLELYAFTQGISIKILGNIVIRIIVSFLFAYYGIYKTASRNNTH